MPDEVTDYIQNIKEGDKENGTVITFFDSSFQLINYIKTIFLIKPNLSTAQYIDKYVIE